MGSVAGSLKVVVIWILGWIGMGMVPSVRIVVLHHHPGEPYEALNARALALRNASYLLFDASCEPIVSLLSSITDIPK